MMAAGWHGQPGLIEQHWRGVLQVAVISICTSYESEWGRTVYVCECSLLVHMFFCEMYSGGCSADYVPLNTGAFVAQAPLR